MSWPIHERDSNEEVAWRLALAHHVVQGIPEALLGPEVSVLEVAEDCYLAARDLLFRFDPYCWVNVALVQSTSYAGDDWFVVLYSIPADAPPAPPPSPVKLAEFGANAVVIDGWFHDWYAPNVGYASGLTLPMDAAVWKRAAEIIRSSGDEQANFLQAAGNADPSRRFQRNVPLTVLRVPSCEVGVVTLPAAPPPPGVEPAERKAAVVEVVEVVEVTEQTEVLLRPAEEKPDLQPSGPAVAPVRPLAPPPEPDEPPPRMGPVSPRLKPGTRGGPVQPRFTPREEPPSYAPTTPTTPGKAPPLKSPLPADRRRKPPGVTLPDRGRLPDNRGQPRASRLDGRTFDRRPSTSSQDPGDPTRPTFRRPLPGSDGPDPDRRSSPLGTRPAQPLGMQPGAATARSPGTTASSTLGTGPRQIGRTMSGGSRR